MSSSKLNLLLCILFLAITPLLYTQSPTTTNNNSLLSEVSDPPPEPEPLSSRQVSDFISRAFDGRVLTGSWRGSRVNGREIFDYFDQDHGFFVIEIVISSIFASPSYDSMYPAPAPLPMKEVWRDGSASTYPSTTGNLQHKEEESKWSLMVKIYDGEYIDQKSISIEYKISTDLKKLSFNENNSSLTISRDLANVKIKEGGLETIVTKKCLTTLSLYFLDKGTMKSWSSSNPRNNVLQFRASSFDCGFDIIADNLSNRGYADFDQIVLYIVVISLTGLLTIIGGLRLEGDFSTKALAFKTSIGTIWLVAMIDYYLLILNVVIVFIYSPIAIIPCVIYLFLIFNAERRAIIKYIQTRGGTSGNFSQNEYRSCGFYFLALGMLFILELVFILTFKLWIIHVSALIFLPQIIHNIKKGKCYSPNYNLLILMGISRLGFVLYAKYYPKNIFRLAPDLQFIEIYGCIILLQLLVLLIQTRYPRLGFGHYKKSQSRLIYEDDLCSICMGHLKNPSCESAGALLNSKSTIETQCGHIFHLDCLGRWVENKPECPVCRKNIEDTVEDMECGDATLVNL